MNINDIYERKFINDLKLHDAEITGIKLKDDIFNVEISCKGMNPSYYFDGIEDIIINLKLHNLKNLSFDFIEHIIINECNIDKKDNVYVMSINEGLDMRVEFEKYDIDIREIKDYNKYYKKLDQFLKNSK